MKQLMTLGIEPGVQNSAAKSLTTLKSEIAEETTTWEKAQAEVDTLTRAVGDLKKMTNKFAAQIPILEEKVKHLDNKVLDRLAKIHAKELGLERTTEANEDYKNKSNRLTKKLESKLQSLLSLRTCIFLNILTLLRLIENDAKLNALKAMVENVVSFLYPNDPSTATRATQLLDGMPTQSWEVILANMK
jgi:chromosome segregation ATPase